MSLLSRSHEAVIESAHVKSSVVAVSDLDYFY